MVASVAVDGGARISLPHSSIRPDIGDWGLSVGYGLVVGSVDVGEIRRIGECLFFC